MGRSILAVLSGLVVMDVLAILSDAAFARISPAAFQPGHAGAPAPMLVAMLAANAVFMVIGGWVAGRLARRRAAVHALVLGVLQLVMTIFSMVSRPHDAVLWFYIALAVLVVPAVWLGGALGARRPAA